MPSYILERWVSPTFDQFNNKQPGMKQKVIAESIIFSSAMTSVSTNDDIKEMAQHSTEPAISRRMYRTACEPGERRDHMAAAEVL